MRKYLLFISIFIFSQISYGQSVIDIDASFNIGSGFNREVSLLSLQQDGKVLVGGYFTYYNGLVANHIVRLNIDGSIDTSFLMGSGFNNKISAIVCQLDGKILVGGEFTSYNGSNTNNIIRLNSDGNIDYTFLASTGNSINNDIFNLVLQKDGKIVVGGNFVSYSGETPRHIIRLNSNGRRDVSFDTGSGFDNEVYSISLQPDNKILVGGNFTKFNGISSNRLIRLNSDGSIDSTFAIGSGFDDVFQHRVYSIAIQSDDKILVGGDFVSFNGSAANYIIRLNSNGSRDTSFVTGIGFNDFVGEIIVQSDGKILIQGHYFTYDEKSSTNIILLNENGSIANLFSSNRGNPSEHINAIALQKDGKILAGGSFTAYNRIKVNRIIRIEGLSVLSTNNFDKNDFIIYPNPVKDIININLQGRDTSLEYVIYDMSGKKITSNKLLENKIDLGSLSKGIYILKIKTGEKIFENKFIKQHSYPKVLGKI